MYSEIVNGEVLDFKFRKRESDTVFLIGDIVIGQIFKTRKSWTAVSIFENKYGPIRGFKSRLDAAEYLLQVFRIGDE